MSRVWPMVMSSALASAVAVGGVLDGLMAAPGLAPQAATISTDAAAVLAEARRTRGGPALDGIGSIEIQARVGSGERLYRLLWPGHFQVRHQFGMNTWNGGEFWQALTVEPPAGRPVSQSWDVEQSTRHEFAVTAMVFLLRVPDGLGLSLSRSKDRALGGFDGKALELSGPKGLSVVFVFDRRDHHLIGYSSVGTVVQSGEEGRVSRATSIILTHREAVGILFPDRMEMLVDTGAMLNESIKIVTQVGSLKVNTLTPDDFRRRPRSSLVAPSGPR